MSPAFAIIVGIVLSFPRVSGDEPVIVAGNLAAGVFSPRERG